MTIPSYLNVKIKGHDNENPKYPNFSLSEYLEQQNVKFNKRDSDDHVEYSTNCPMCKERGEERNDTKNRLWANPKKGTFYCYNCQWGGPLVRLIQHFSNTSYESAVRILRGKKPNPLEHLNFSLYQEVFEEDEDRDMQIKKLEFPYGFEPFKKGERNIFTEYLKFRGIPIQYAIEKKWGYCEEGYTSNRIIVPTFINEVLSFWQARDVLDESHPDYGMNNYRKVLNPKGFSATKVLYNYDSAKKYNEIILCEGFVDAVKAGDNAVATNGKHLHDAQMQLLTETSAESIVILWDYDAFHDGTSKKKSSVDRAKSILSACFEVRCIELPKGYDAGDYECGELAAILSK